MAHRTDPESRWRRASGFSLIEVLVAFTIMAIVLVGLLNATGRGLRSIEAAETQTRLLAVARNRLADVGTVVPLAPGNYRGEDAGVNWRIDIARRFADDGADEEAEALGLALYEVSVAVQPEEGGSERRLHTLRLGSLE